MGAGIQDTQDRGSRAINCEIESAVVDEVCRAIGRGKIGGGIVGPSLIRSEDDRATDNEIRRACVLGNTASVDGESIARGAEGNLLVLACADDDATSGYSTRGYANCNAASAIRECSRAEIDGVCARDGCIGSSPCASITDTPESA